VATSNPVEVLRQTKRQARDLADKVGVDRVKVQLERAQKELNQRLIQVEGLKGPGPDSFTATQMRLTLKQVELSLASLTRGMKQIVIAQGTAAADKATTDLLAYMHASEQRYRGIATRLPLQEASMFDRVKMGTHASILHRLASDPQDPAKPGIVTRYGGDVMVHFEEQLQQSLIQGTPWAEVRGNLVSASPFLQQAPAFWAERLVRTETMGAFGRAAWEGTRQADAVLGDMVKILSATFDDRTGWDSYQVHGQIRRPDEAFQWNGRNYQHPPNRPNDREVVVPHRLSWPLPAELKWRSDGEVAARWASEGRKGGPPGRPTMTTVPLDDFGKAQPPMPPSGAPAPPVAPPTGVPEGGPPAPPPAAAAPAVIPPISVQKAIAEQLLEAGAAPELPAPKPLPLTPEAAANAKLDALDLLDGKSVETTGHLLGLPMLEDAGALPKGFSADTFEAKIDELKILAAQLAASGQKVPKKKQSVKVGALVVEDPVVPKKLVQQAIAQKSNLAIPGYWYKGKWIVAGDGAATALGKILKGQGALSIHAIDLNAVEQMHAAPKVAPPVAAPKAPGPVLGATPAEKKAGVLKYLDEHPEGTLTHGGNITPNSVVPKLPALSTSVMASATPAKVAVTDVHFFDASVPKAEVKMGVNTYGKATLVKIDGKLYSTDAVTDGKLLALKLQGLTHIDANVVDVDKIVAPKVAAPKAAAPVVSAPAPKKPNAPEVVAEAARVERHLDQEAQRLNPYEAVTEWHSYSNQQMIDAADTAVRVTTQRAQAVKAFTYGSDWMIRAVDRGLSDEETITAEMAHRGMTREAAEAKLVKVKGYRDELNRLLLDHSSPTTLGQKGEQYTAVYRGIGTLSRKTFEKFLTEPEITLNAVSSSSRTPKVATSPTFFGRTNANPYRVLLRLKARSGVYVESITDATSEQELVLPSWAKFKVTKRALGDVDKQTLVIEAEEIAPDPVALAKAKASAERAATPKRDRADVRTRVREGVSYADQFEEGYQPPAPAAKPEQKVGARTKAEVLKYLETAPERIVHSNMMASPAQKTKAEQFSDAPSDSETVVIHDVKFWGSTVSKADVQQGLAGADEIILVKLNGQYVSTSPAADAALHALKLQGEANASVEVVDPEMVGEMMGG
jgi:hypothetical protein